MILSICISYVNAVKGGVESYLKINLGKQIRALYIDAHLITESMAIVHYLEETRPGPISLLPSDPFQRATIRKLCEQINAGIQPLQNSKVLAKLSEDFKADEKAWAHYWNYHGLTALEKLMKDTAGKYSVGDTLSLDDAYLVPQA